MVCFSYCMGILLWCLIDILFHADALVKVLTGGGSVLLPIDTAGRVLEILLILEQVKSWRSCSRTVLFCYVNNMFTFCLDLLQYWAQRHLIYPIYFLTNVSTSTVDYVKSFLEWMNDSISKSFEHTRDNAFLLKYEWFLLLSFFSVHRFVLFCAYWQLLCIASLKIHDELIILHFNSPIDMFPLLLSPYGVIFIFYLIGLSCYYNTVLSEPIQLPLFLNQRYTIICL